MQMQTTGYRLLNTQKAHGFSLIELLVVVGILAVLMAMLMANIASGRARARDSVRKADFDSVKKALRIYYNDYQTYPAADGTRIAGCGDGTVACSFGGAFATANTEYMKRLPIDPVDSGSNIYTYAQTEAGEGFLLSTYLETVSDESDGRSQLRCGVINDVVDKTPQLYVECEK
jgi:prepilin-type N-terminal cleavage/methylation domain-containing protein